MRAFPHIRFPRAAVALIGSILMLLATLASSASAAVANPDLQPACGTKVILVLDESGSIQNTAGAETAVRDAANAFASGLADTGSQLAVIEFGTSAKRVFNYTNVTSGAGGSLATTFQPYFSGSAASPADVYDSPSQTGPWTNWEDALEEVKLLNTSGGVAPLVVFITDGDPTATGRTAPFATNVASATALPPAIVQADAVKTQGSHILAVGVGAALNNATSLARLNAISGPDTATSAAALNLATTDVLAIANFANLSGALGTLVSGLCQSSVTINKLVDDGQGFVPGGAGWTFGGNVTTAAGTYTWITPNPGAPGPRTATTGADSSVTFQWKPTVSTTSTLTVTESQKLGYQFVGVTCQVKSAANPTPVTLPVTATGASFPLTLGPTDIVTCEVKNKKINPSVSITKTATPTVVTPGSPVTWNVTVTNTGDVPLSNVVVTDPAATGCQIPAAPAVSLAVGASITRTCTTPNITSLTTNTATVNAKDPQGTPLAPKDASATVRVKSIEITKSVDQPVVVPGQQVTWTVTVTNTGEVDLTNVQVTDPVATGCATTAPITLAAGASRQLTCTQAITAQTVNTATVSSAELPSKSASATVRTKDVLITKTVSEPVVIAGTQVTWTVTVRNTGDVALTNVQVADPNATACATVAPITLGPGASQAFTCTQTITTATTNVATVSSNELPSKSASADVKVKGLSITKSVSQPFVVSGTEVTWTVIVTNSGDVELTGVDVVDPAAPVGCSATGLTLAAGTSITLTCSEPITQGKTNTATVSAPGVPPLSASAAVAVKGLSITKAVDKATVVSGTVVTWTIVVTNTGEVPLSNVVVTDPQAVGCQNAEPLALAPGASATLTCSQPAATTTDNVASVTGKDPAGGDVPPVSATAKVTVIAPGLSIIKLVDKAQVTPGDRVTYTITVQNTGDVELTNVAVKDPTVPACDTVIGTLAAGATTTVTCIATINADTTNVATVTGTDPLGNPVTKDATAKVTVGQIVIIGASQTTLKIDKRGPTTAKGGQVISYRIKITNTGTVTANSVVMRDRLPAGMALASKAGGVQLVKGSAVVNVGDLAPGASKTIVLKVRIDRTAAGTRTNVATASAANALQVRDSARTKIVRVAGGARIPIVTG
jgi:uncharacterized repeat protein (TIGR01451 family)